MIDVVVADDEALVRGGIRMILEAQGDLVVVGEAADGAEAVRLVVDLRPAVVLMDVRMPRLDGLEATRRIVRSSAGTRALMLTTFDQDAHVYDALRAGAGGFLLKSSPPEHLVHAVRVVAAGESLLDPSITRRLVERFVSRPSPATADRDVLTRISDRESEVLRLVARGLSNSEIARTLFLSEGTVKTHVNRLLRKLDLRDRVQAVVLAYESGLVEPGEVER
ncbi:response regulator [Actinomycetospora soli]|uniref:response regulator n=1 Tax=Actinomycetospora soli TaxID=2893887 RepID=UPI001E5B598B|nr:response regulator transcription factor [Actinomycetospora soli]MCD2185663.1 response regulator transcription factor [Actinomycetospora soli]